jgi:GNAT superfamily N-acetyltransferase
MPCTPRRCPDPEVLNVEQVLVERHHAERFLAEAMVPGAEVHHDPDITWVVHPGQAWRNAGIMVRFSAASAERRLDTLLARYEEHGRGMALWVSPAATPANLPALLRTRRLRCQKHFPAMLRRLADPVSEGTLPAQLEIRRVVDVAEYETTPHPTIGPLTTPLRRQAFERLRALVADRSDRARAFVAWIDGSPVGAAEIFLGTESAGIHGLSVLEGYEGRGIGSALIEHVCRDAVRSGGNTMVLLASTEGQRLYERRGFREVGRFGYWYRSFRLRPV